ncbi:uncharacterized protein JCM15063_005994 [Sporobolomyces koalae]|uniref:uncharacterized protein n=1 Tax=Sporobolomyces koalae TaxID=500713 RepID=UPI0031746F34
MAFVPVPLSFSNPSTNLLYTVASTLLVTSLVCPLFLAPRFVHNLRLGRRNDHEDLTRGLALALVSTLALSLSGVCSLVAIASGTVTAAVGGGIFGALSLLTIDTQTILALLWKPRMSTSGWFTVALSSLLLLTTALQVTLLALNDPDGNTLFRLAYARGIIHLGFDLIVIGAIPSRQSTCPTAPICSSSADAGEPVSSDPPTSITPEASLPISGAPPRDRSRRPSVSSTFSLSANFPPPISEEGERINTSAESAGSTDSSEAYLHTQTFPAPFARDKLDDSDRDRSEATSKIHPVTASTTPDASRPVTPQSSVAIYARARKNAGNLSRPKLSHTYSSASSLNNLSPTANRPHLCVDIDQDDSYHTAVSDAPARSLRSDSGLSTPSPVKNRRPLLRSLIGISPGRLVESPPTHQGIRRGSRSSSFSFLRGQFDEEPATPTLEIETDEEDPFAAVQATHAIEAAKKVDEWARRKASNASESEGGFEEDIEIVSTTRHRFRHIDENPSRVSASMLAQFRGPELYPRRSPSSSSSLFHEHFGSDGLGEPIQLRKLSSPGIVEEYRTRSRSYGSSASFDGTVGPPLRSTPPYRFGKSFSCTERSSPSTPSSSVKLLDVLGMRPSVSGPPRPDIPSSRPLSSQNIVKAESLQQHPDESPFCRGPRARSSAPSLSSLPLSPRVSPVRRLFARRPSAVDRLLPSPPMLNKRSSSHELPQPKQARKSSRASSTFSAASFSLRKLRRRSSLNIPFASSRTTAATGGAASLAPLATLHRCPSSDLSFLCRGEQGSSYRSSTAASLARSASIQLPPVGGSHSSTEEATPRIPKTSTTATSDWWNHDTLESRPSTPYRASSLPRQPSHSRTNSAPTLSSRSPEQDNASACRRRGRSRSLPLARLSDYQLEPPDEVAVASSLGPAIVLGTPHRSAKSARSSMSITISKHSNRNKIISVGDLEELTALYETFTPSSPPPLDHSGSENLPPAAGQQEEASQFDDQEFEVCLSTSTLGSSSPIIPSPFGTAYTPTSPTSTRPPARSTESEYWIPIKHGRSQESIEPTERLEGFGQSHQMF